MPAGGGIHVPLPTSINHRLQGAGGKHAWSDLINEVEDVGHNLHEFSSTVVEKNTKLTAANQAGAAVKWHSGLEIEMIQKIIAAPMLEPAKLQEQEADMRNQPAEIIASKLIGLAKLANIYGGGGK